MNTKCLGTIEKMQDTFGSLVDALDMLSEAINEEDEEKIDQAMNMLPSPKQVSASLEKLVVLIKVRPWESGKKKAHA